MSHRGAAGRHRQGGLRRDTAVTVVHGGHHAGAVVVLAAGTGCGGHGGADLDLCDGSQVLADDGCHAGVDGGRHGRHGGGDYGLVCRHDERGGCVVVTVVHGHVHGLCRGKGGQRGEDHVQGEHVCYRGLRFELMERMERVACVGRCSSVLKDGGSSSEGE